MLVSLDWFRTPTGASLCKANLISKRWWWILMRNRPLNKNLACVSECRADKLKQNGQMVHTTLLIYDLSLDYSTIPLGELFAKDLDTVGLCKVVDVVGFQRSPSWLRLASCCSYQYCLVAGWILSSECEKRFRLPSSQDVTFRFSGTLTFQHVPTDVWNSELIKMMCSICSIFGVRNSAEVEPWLVCCVELPGNSPVKHVTSRVAS